MKTPDASVMKAIVDILTKEKAVQSQTRLEALLSERLDIKTGGRRLRRLARKSGARIAIEWKRGEDVSSCPFCGKMLKNIYSPDLFGKETLSAKKCACGFKSYRGRRPRRYIFTRGRKNAV